MLVTKYEKWWFCVDYRRLKAATEHDTYLLSQIDKSLDALAGSQYFSTFDLVSGYWQIPLDKDAREKSAFITGSELWKWSPSFRTDFCSSHLPAIDGDSVARAPLANLTIIPG